MFNLEESGDAKIKKKQSLPMHQRGLTWLTIYEKETSGFLFNFAR